MVQQADMVVKYLFLLKVLKRLPNAGSTPQVMSQSEESSSESSNYRSSTTTQRI